MDPGTGSDDPRSPEAHRTLERLLLSSCFSHRQRFTDRRDRRSHRCIDAGHAAVCCQQPSHPGRWSTVAPLSTRWTSLARTPHRTVPGSSPWRHTHEGRSPGAGPSRFAGRSRTEEGTDPVTVREQPRHRQRHRHRHRQRHRQRHRPEGSPCLPLPGLPRPRTPDISDAMDAAILPVDHQYLHGPVVLGRGHEGGHLVAAAGEVADHRVAG